MRYSIFSFSLIFLDFNSPQPPSTLLMTTVPNFFSKPQLIMASAMTALVGKAN